MIVIALLAMLSLVGVVFYTFAAQERSNAEYFAYARKAEASGDQPGDVFFDYGLRQLIVGPDNFEQQSALWGKSHSMVPNMFGRDAHPFTGAGVNLITDNQGRIFVDQDFNGVPDDGRFTNGNSGPKEKDLSNLLEFNISPAARNGTTLNLTQQFPRGIDVEYTYPDINNLFISYDGRGLDTNNTTAQTRFRRVIIPSFHRPQYLRKNGTQITDWYTNTETATRVLRPHPDHVNVIDGSPRYFGIDGVRGGGDDFPFIPVQNTSGLSGTFGQMGVWTNWGNTSQDNIYELDVDNNNDGIKEGVWLDLGYPVQLLADGTEYIPLFSFTVIDADALLNLNVHGNTRQFTAPIDGSRFGGGRFISTSNQGIDPGEVNLQVAFHANPIADPSANPPLFDFGNRTQAELDAALEQYRLFFGRNPADRQELSNMEYFFLTRGRAEFSSSGGTQNDVTDLFPGRYGEHLTALFNSIRVNANGSMLPRNFPQPGRTGFNDQGSADPNRNFPQFGHPLAYSGRGWYWNLRTVADRRRKPDLNQAAGPSNPSVWLRYSNYQRKSSFYPRWGQTLSNRLMNNAGMNAEIDDAMETIVERDFVQTTDDVFGPEETAYAQLSKPDRDSINVTSRVEELMPFSRGAVETASSQAAAKRVTAQSWDRKHFGFPRNFIGRRGWEFNRDVNNDNFGDAFPPSFKPIDFDNANIGTWNTGINREPFRDALTLLMATINGSTQRGRPQFKLNLNRLLYSPKPGRLAYRPLTNHPIDPGNTPVNPSGSTVQQQEFRARRDRQTMCRDIYVLLYTLGGGIDSMNYSNTNDHSGTMTTTAAGAGNDWVYTRDQLREMAQFAVNLVDSMDRDEVITKFEYDKNLGATVDDSGNILRAGWNLDNNPYTIDAGFPILRPNDRGYDAGYPEDSIERGVVFGVEAQQLTFSEAQAVYAPKFIKANMATDHKVTQWDDRKPTYFSFLELRNASPHRVNFNNGQPTSGDDGAWQIEVEVAVQQNGNRVILSQRYLTLKRSSVRPGELFSINSIGGSLILDRFTAPDDLNNHSAHLVIDQNYDANVQIIPNHINRISPANVLPASLDLISPPPTTVGQRYGLTLAGGESADPATGRQFVALLDDLNMSNPPTPGTEVTFRLRRRAHAGRGVPASLNTAYDKDNPWIVVDQMAVGFQQQLGFEQLSIDENIDVTGAQFLDNLSALKSLERVQPLDRRNERRYTGPPAFIQNTLGRNNRSSASRFTLWQQHFDRDVASVGELLGIPLYGPGDVTRFIRPGQKVPLREYNDFTKGRYFDRQDNKRARPLTAASLMLQPQHPFNIGLPTFTGSPGVGPGGAGPPGPNGDGPPGRGGRPPNGTFANPQRDNRWYRLLEFVEVPTRTHLALGNPLNITRVPGRMNLNMFRNPESLVGLIDDSNVVDLGRSYLNNPTSGYAPMPMTPIVPGGPIPEGGNRDWWEQMIKARDRFDSVTRLYLPGTANSRPFRSLSFVADGNRSIEHTLLRQLPNDEFDDPRIPLITDPPTSVNLNNLTSRRLLEIGDAAQHKAGNIDPYIRRQLLSKVWGNTTNRSHVFVVFISVGYFEAKDMGNGAVRIGNQLVHGTDLDGTAIEHRGVFVVNRSRIEEAIKPGTNKVNWRKLVDFRQTIE